MVGAESILAEGLRQFKDEVEANLPISLEKWPLEIFLFSAVVCFVASSVMHLLWVRSPRVCNITHNIDLSGISLVIFGSAYGLIYYIFKCEPVSYYIYFGTQVFSMLGILFCINCKLFNQDKWQNLKVILFVLQGAVALLSVLHWRMMK